MNYQYSIKDRVSYYVGFLEPTVVCRGDFLNKSHRYTFMGNLSDDDDYNMYESWVRYLRDSPNNKNKDMVFRYGDVRKWGGSDKIIPIITKSRVIHTKNMVISNLDQKRHWGRVDGLDNYDIPYNNKIDTPVWRGMRSGVIYMNDRIMGNRRQPLVEKYFNNKAFDVGFCEHGCSIGGLV